jgi:hypothetical protein
LGAAAMSADLLAAQHDRQRARHMRTGCILRHQLGAIERDVEEELQSRDRGVERDRRGALIDAVQLERYADPRRGGIG